MRRAIRTLFLFVAVFVPLSAKAQVDVNVNVNVPLPPPVVFASPPEVVVLPETNVYVVPDVEEEIFFSAGWWWRPWQGRWYRSRYYDRGWVFYRAAPPRFYRHVPPGWRNDYHEHRWHGQEWRHERIPHHEVQRNWRGWERDRHWQQPGPHPMAPPPGPPRGGHGFAPPQPGHAGGPPPGPPRGGHGFAPPQPGHAGGQPPGPPPGQARGRGPDNRGGHGRR